MSGEVRRGQDLEEPKPALQPHPRDSEVTAGAQSRCRREPKVSFSLEGGEEEASAWWAAEVPTPSLLE